MEGKETNHVTSTRNWGGGGATRNYCSPVDLKHLQGVSE